MKEHFRTLYGAFPNGEWKYQEGRSFLYCTPASGRMPDPQLVFLELLLNGGLKEEKDRVQGRPPLERDAWTKPQKMSKGQSGCGGGRYWWRGWYQALSQVSSWGWVHNDRNNWAPLWKCSHKLPQAQALWDASPAQHGVGTSIEPMQQGPRW